MSQVFSGSFTPRWLDTNGLTAFHSTVTDAHRVYNETGCWIERFGNDFLISHTTERQRDLAIGELHDWCRTHALPIGRLYGKALADTESDRHPPQLLQGDPAQSPQTVVSENGTRYGLDFSASYSAGLFIDQRANRTLWKEAPPRRLLNCFAYTCSFSVIAASVGAETVSVDLSKKSLDRGRANFELNQIEMPAAVEGHAPRHRFISDDVFGVLPYLKKRGETFDGIVLDPPTFARGTKRKVFRVETDFPLLLDLALDLASPHARLLLSTNCTRLQLRDLERFAHNAASQRGLRASYTPGPPLPDIPPTSMPTTLWMQIGS